MGMNVHSQHLCQKLEKLCKEQEAKESSEKTGKVSLVYNGSYWTHKSSMRS